MVLAFIEVGIFLSIMAGCAAWNFLRGDDAPVTYIEPRRPRRAITKPIVRKLDCQPYDWARKDDWR
jgi:hypothetical protein